MIKHRVLFFETQCIFTRVGLALVCFS